MQEISDVADCIVDMYRSCGTELRLAIEIAALKRQKYADIWEADCAAQNGEALNAYEKFDVSVSC